ncbi:MAG: hypothetical protein H7222_14720 [Methylotenera sp.]|nr:hypothetical protein [Oligoflexia bacterium]
MKTLGLFGVIVADFVGYSGAGVAVGYFLWKKLDFPWWILLVTSIGGLYLASYQLYRLSEKDMK